MLMTFDELDANMMIKYKCRSFFESGADLQEILESGVCYWTDEIYVEFTFLGTNERGEEELDVENVIDNREWYAVMVDSDDDDYFSYGSYDIHEAKEMLKDFQKECKANCKKYVESESYIAVVKNKVRTEVIR